MHCLLVERVSGEANREEIKLVTIGDVQMAILHQCIQDRLKKRADKRLIRAIKKYCNKNTIVVAKEQTVEDLGVPNLLFAYRKQELLKNIKGIMCYLKDNSETQGRRRFLLVLHSQSWSKRELKEILQEAKEHYEDLYIVYEDKESELEELSAYFYRECGVVLHLHHEEDGRMFDADSVLFLVKEWNEHYKQFGYQNGYVVAEWEHFVRRKVALHNSLKKCSYSKRMLYAGFIYKYQTEEIVYELALPLLYHERLLHLLQSTCAENAISIVAIYALE